jgi:hypothetical protein
MAHGDVANRHPQLRHPLARKPVEDAVALAPRAREPGLCKQTQVMRGGCDALTHLGGDLVDRPLALCQHIHDLRAPPVPKRPRHRRKGVEQGTLRRSITHKIKLTFE